MSLKLHIPAREPDTVRDRFDPVVFANGLLRGHAMAVAAASDAIQQASNIVDRSDAKIISDLEAANERERAILRGCSSTLERARLDRSIKDRTAHIVWLRQRTSGPEAA